MDPSSTGLRVGRLLPAVIGLLVAACGSSDPSPGTGLSTAPTSPTAATATTAPTTTTALAEAGPAAPDFTLALGDGSDFTLSAEQKPVYMVFWAEW